MGKYILDTHTLLWHSLNDPFLSDTAIETIESDEALFVSYASIWEMAIKIRIGKLKLQKPLAHFIEEIIEANEYRLLEIKMNHLYLLSDLPYHHKDPFDRLLIAQGIEEDMTIITRDEAFKSYQVKTCW